MRPQFGLVYPLWNHAADTGAAKLGAAAENLLDRAVGEIGIDYLTIPVVTGETHQFRPHWFPQQPYFHTDGGWHFPPEAGRYQVSGFRPRAARWLGHKDVLATVCEEAARRARRVHLLVDLREVTQLFEPEPHLAQRNAWGEALRPYVACISNPHFRELLQATLHDLLRYAPSAYVVARLTLDSAPSPNKTRGPAFDPTGLFYHCFCPACRQLATGAGIDADAAARSARVLMGTPRPTIAATREAVLADVLTWQYRECRVVPTLTWVRALADSLTGRTLLYDSARRSVMDERGHWCELWRSGPFNTWEIISNESAAALLRDVRSSTPPRVCCDVSGFRFSQRGAAALVTEVEELCRAGASYIEFAGLDEIPPEMLTWVRQAVRYARRE